MGMPPWVSLTPKGIQWEESAPGPPAETVPSPIYWPSLGDMVRKPPLGFAYQVDRSHRQCRCLLSWWPMMNEGGLIATDVIGGRHGTLTSFTIANAWLWGKDGSAPNFESAGYITFSQYTLNTNTGSTIMFRAKRNVTNAVHAVFGNSGTTAKQIIDLSNAGTIRAFTNSINDSAVGTLYSNDTNWHHYALVLSGLSAQFYQDGRALVMTDSVVTDAEMALDRIGIRSTSTVPFNGLIDDVRIYNRALSQSEIKYIDQEPWAPFVGWSGLDIAA